MLSDLVRQVKALPAPTPRTRAEWERKVDPIARLMLDAASSDEAVDLADARSRLDGMRQLKQTGPLVKDGRFVYRNVVLDWPAVWAKWQFPPADFTTFTTTANGAASVHVLGECWGMSKVTHPLQGGAVLVTGDFGASPAGRVAWGANGDTVVCALGTTYTQIHDFLDAAAAQAGGPQMSLPNQPGFSDMTIAGTIGVGAHGSSLHQGSLASLVQCVKVATDAQNATTVKRGDPHFDAFVTHLGRLGPVVEMELSVVPRFQIEETREIKRLGTGGTSWRADLDNLVKTVIATQQDPHVHSCELWIAPYPDWLGRLVVAVGTRRIVNGQPVTTPKDQRPPALRCAILQKLARAISTIAAGIDPAFARSLLRWAVQETRTAPVVMEAREGLDFGAANENRMTTIEAAFEIPAIPNASPIIAAIDELEWLAAHNGLYVFAPLGVRFVGQGEQGGLSPQAGRAGTLHIEISTFADGKLPLFRGPELLPPLQSTLAKLGGRPHWGLNVFLSKPELLALWPASAWTEFETVVNGTPQAAKFSNELIDDLLTP